jgi:hypothetical protein
MGAERGVGEGRFGGGIDQRTGASASANGMTGLGLRSGASGLSLIPRSTRTGLRPVCRMHFRAGIRAEPFFVTRDRTE